jgi:hypothetical protein
MLTIAGALHHSCLCRRPPQRWHVGCNVDNLMLSTNEAETGEAPTDVTSAEQEVARAKRQLQESLRSAGEAGSRLAREARNQLTPMVLVTVAVGVAVVAGVALVAARDAPQRRARATNRASWGGILARAAGAWLLRAVALRVAEALEARLRDAPALGHSASEA